MNVGAGRYALGVAALVVICGSLALAAVALRRRCVADWSGAQARLAEALIGFTLLFALLELLGAVGLFRLWAIVLGSVLIAIVVRREPSTVRPRRATSIASVAGVVVAATLITEWASPTLESYTVGIRTFDSLWYHLPWAATSAQTGHITPLRFTDVEYLTAFYPATSELVHGLGIVLFARDTLSPGLNLAWLGLALLAAYCIGRPRGIGATTTLGAALALATPMMYFSQAGSAANDIVGIWFLLAAVAVVAGDGSPVLGGLAAGWALGVKLTLVAPALALTVGAIAIAPARGRTARRWLVPMVLAGGFWYVRNLIAVGNPLPWTSFGGVLPVPASPLQQHTGFSVAHYLFDGRGWSHFFEPGLASGLGRWWYLVVACAVLAPLLCLLPGAGRTVRMLGLVALASIVAYVFTPETAAGPAGDPSGFAFNLRYAAPALALSLAVLPLAPLFAGTRRQLALAIALVAVLIATVWQTSLWPSPHLGGAALIGGVALLVGLAVVARRAWALVAVGALVIALAIAGYPWQRRYLRGRYAYEPGVSYLAPTWAFFRHVHDARVGVVGTFGGFFSYPMFGLDVSNRVQYVARRGPHGSFTPIATCAGWRAAVNAGHFRYVVTTPSRDPWHPRRLGPSPESAWTASDPAARLVLLRRALGQPIAVYELRRPLDPAACA